MMNPNQSIEKYIFKSTRSPLIETQELFELIKQQVPLKILHAGYPLTKQDGEPDSIFLKERIPSAQQFDLKEVFDKNATHPNTLCSNEQFSNYMKNKNLKKDDLFVIYDDFGVVGACRTWFNLLFLFSIGGPFRYLEFVMLIF